MPTLEFKGKQFVYSHHLGVPFRELQMVPDKSLPANGQKPSLDDNLIIHGDNLEALKALLPTHAGKVDCIFIDPPYNTGNEGWCYNDNVRSPLMREWLKKSANPVDKEDLERHDKWLCMMWPRLQLLRELLSENGSLWVSIDDNEDHRLRQLLDEVFGMNGYITEIAWRHSDNSSNNVTQFSQDFNTILVYSKNEYWTPHFSNDPDKRSHFSNSDNDPKGPWFDGNPVNNPAIRKTLQFDYPGPDGNMIKHPPNGWRWSKETMDQKFQTGELRYSKNGKRVIRRTYLSEQQGLPPSSFWNNVSETGHTRGAKVTLKQIFGDDYASDLFSTPKPVQVIRKVLGLATDSDSIILDSFAGSGTTAHAVLEANKKDNGNRRFIMVECEDYADTLTAERIRRVIKGHSYSGTQRDELHRENITWSTFEKKQIKVLEHIASIENLQSHKYDKINKQIKDGVLTVTGERKVKETAPGLGGSFTYCTLGEPIDIESLLTGKGLPGFEALARYVFYTATGQSLEKVGKPTPDGFIGETDLFRVHLFYQPEREWLRSNDAALNAERMAAIEKGNKRGKRAIVFAVAKFMSQKELTARRIEFCQLPYAVHRILGD